MNHILRSATGALVAGIIATGCATSPPSSEVAAARAAIDNAGQAVDHASADPHVAKYAPSELERATASLQKAKTAWNEKHDLTATQHFAYLAQQRAATAQEFANELAADEAVKVAAAELNQTMSVAVHTDVANRAQSRIWRKKTWWVSLPEPRKSRPAPSARLTSWQPH